MKELSIFIDESGDFREYSFHSPYYIVTMVFHNQSHKIDDAIMHLETSLSTHRLDNHCIHTGPIIRKEENYKYLDVIERRKILNKMVVFFRKVDIKYKCFYIEKQHIDDIIEASGKLSKLISMFIREHYAEFLTFDIVKIYYDNGQIELTKILSSVFNAMLPKIEFRKVLPSEFKLFQVADLLCSFCLIDLKLSHGCCLSHSELTFFGNLRDLKKNYLKPIKKKEWLFPRRISRQAWII